MQTLKINIFTLLFVRPQRKSTAISSAKNKKEEKRNEESPETKSSNKENKETSLYYLPVHLM